MTAPDGVTTGRRTSIALSQQTVAGKAYLGIAQCRLVSDSARGPVGVSVRVQIMEQGGGDA